MDNGHVQVIKNTQIVEPQERSDWMMDHTFNRKDGGGNLDNQATIYHLTKHPIIQVKLDKHIITQHALEPWPKRSLFYVRRGIPNYNVEITENYITWHGDDTSKNVYKLYSYNSTTKVAIDMNGRVYLPVEESTNTVDENLLKDLDLRTLDELGLAAR